MSWAGGERAGGRRPDGGPSPRGQSPPPPGCRLGLSGPGRAPPRTAAPGSDPAGGPTPMTAPARRRDCGNTLLDIIPDDEFNALNPALTRVRFALRQLVQEYEAEI